MNTLVVSFAAMFWYLAAASQVCLPRDIFGACGRRRWLLLFGLLAVIAHAGLLYQSIHTPLGLNLGFFNAASLITWVIAVLVLVALIKRPVQSLALVLFPLSAASIALAVYFPSGRVLPEGLPVGVKLHILSSILAYSLLCLSAFQALFLAIQDHRLHSRHPGWVMQLLPPLQVMENLLVQILTAGFVLLSLSLLSGAMFLENLFTQHLVHKTVLSIAAWMMFALLLWGRVRYGWRGRTLIRWNLGGFFLLMLAYFGSKLVRELILLH